VFLRVLQSVVLCCYRAKRINQEHLSVVEQVRMDVIRVLVEIYFSLYTEISGVYMSGPHVCVIHTVEP